MHPIYGWSLDSFHRVDTSPPTLSPLLSLFAFVSDQSVLSAIGESRWTSMLRSLKLLTHDDSASNRAQALAS